MKKYIVEFIGTFFLVLTVCMAGSKAGEMAPIAIGGALMVMVYAGGYISGGHYNPAVSFAVWIRGKLSLTEMISYWVVQLAGGVAAALLAQHVFDYIVVPHDPIGKTAIIAEAIGTFALAFVVLNVATSQKTSGNSNYGLAIGFTVTVMAYTLGPVSGGAFNPAVALGNTVFGGFYWNELWMYVIGTLAGAALAGLLYNYLKPDTD